MTFVHVHQHVGHKCFTIRAKLFFLLLLSLSGYHFSNNTYAFRTIALLPNISVISAKQLLSAKPYIKPLLLVSFITTTSHKLHHSLNIFYFYCLEKEMLLFSFYKFITTTVQFKKYLICLNFF